MGPPDSEEVKLDFAVPTYQGTSPTDSGFVEPGAPGSVGRPSAIELPGPCLSFYPRALPSDLSDAFGHVSELHIGEPIKPETAHTSGSQQNDVRMPWFLFFCKWLMEEICQ